MSQSSNASTSASLQALPRKLVRSFSVMLLMLLVLLGFALWNFHRLGQADTWKAHTFEVLLEAQLLKESLFVMDNSLRGYIVNGNPGELTGLDQGKQDFHTHLLKLQNLTDDNPLQESYLRTANREKDHYLDLVTATLKLRLPTDPSDVARKKVSPTTNPRRAAVNTINKTIGTFENTERGLLKQRSEAQDRWRGLTETTLWIGSAFSILLTLFLSSLATRAVKESALAYSRLRESNGQLEFSNTQLAMAKDGLEVEVGQRREAEERLRRVVGELRRSNAELEQFAYVASHDLQEPLRAVAGCVQVLKRRYEGKLDARADQFIDHAVDGAQRMQNLINDLLAYSRVGTKGKPFTEVSLEKVVDGALLNLTAVVQESNAHIERVPLPKLYGDAGQLEQVFQNLLSNAIKFRGEAPPEVKVNAVPTVDPEHGKGWTISISDRGPGIEPQYFERIFVMFQRLHTRTEYPGTGIGLAIVKKIIERHGGYIWVESEVGQGTTFSFWLPEHATDHLEKSDDDMLEANLDGVRVEKSRETVAGK